MPREASFPGKQRRVGQVQEWSSGVLDSDSELPGTELDHGGREEEYDFPDLVVESVSWVLLAPPSRDSK